MEHYDIALFKWINGHHNIVTDWTLWTFSQAWSWGVLLAAVYVVLLASMKKNKMSLHPYWWLLLAGVALCFLFSDQISVHCFKNVFERYRPCHALEDVRMFRTTCGGRYGFVSSHAANSFSVAMFLGLSTRLLTKGALRKFSFPLLLLWALLVGYSRPYLGKHYPGDVVCGALLGIVVGALVYWIAFSIARRVSEKVEQ